MWTHLGCGDVERVGVGYGGDVPTMSTVQGGFLLNRREGYGRARFIFVKKFLKQRHYSNCIQGGHGTGKTGKTGNLVLTFSRQGKHREFSLTQGKILRHRENI